MTLAELSRMRPMPEEDRRVLEAVEARRRDKKLGPGQQAILTHIEGRFLIEQDRARGESSCSGAPSRRPSSCREPTPRPARPGPKLRLTLFAAGKSGEWSRARSSFRRGGRWSSCLEVLPGRRLG